MATKALPFPKWDSEVAIDNDQKLKKQWSVRAQGKMACSVVTSLCQAEHQEQMEVQNRADLSPASWGNYAKAPQDKLKMSLQTSKRSGEVHRAEVRKLVHERLAKVANEQSLQGGQYVDYVDIRVADEKKKDSSGKDFSSCLPVAAMAECIQIHHIGDHWAVSCTQEGKTGVSVYGCMYTTVGMSLCN
ncbi:hypothetical protein Bbelb_292450 [Branchiostoma belcheri]|nr:hypothetical protein Bbelb_292450 [Branchiostoma belcheri]